MMTAAQRDRGKDLVQVLAIASLAALFAVIAHKGYADISLIADKHSGSQFWVAVARYLLANLASG